MASSHQKSVAAARAHDYQTQTRKERNFDEMESALPCPDLPTLKSAFSMPTADKLTSYLGSRNPFGHPVETDDVVWLFDNTAFRSSAGQWEAEFIAAVFEREPKAKVVDIVSGIAEKLGLADDAKEKDTIEHRLMPFLWDVRPARYLDISHVDAKLRLGPTGRHGMSADVLKVSAHQNDGAWVESQARVPEGVSGALEMQTFFAEPEGWGVVSDIDDTIKITQTSDPLGILRKTFVDTPTPVPGMPELYKHIVSIMPQESPWFYLSASPYNLYPFLRDFCARHFPRGTLILRDSSWRTIAGLLSALTLGTEEYKTDRMHKIHSWLPKRKMILIGDSTQSDPEAYGEICREHKEWVKLILIRKETDIAAVGIESKNADERFEKAFKDIPRETWHVFEDPAECHEIVTKTMAQG